MPDALDTVLRRELVLIEEAQLTRRLRPPSGVDFCSNDYLALSAHPMVVSRAIEALRSAGVGSTGSRLLRGERDAFSALEQRFALFKRAERALFFSSGYLANVAVLTTLPRPGDVVFSDERNHASLIDGIRLSKAMRVVVSHLDVDALAEALASTAIPARAFIVTESVFSMDGDVAPLQAYVDLCRRTGATLIVDEAHAVGVCGPTGRGCLEEVDDAGVSVVCVSTAGKALGVAGAFVTASDTVIEYLIQRARPFLFSTAPPPALAAAIEASLDLIDAEPERRRALAQRVGWLRDGLTAVGVRPPTSASHILPIILGDNERAVRVASALQAAAFDVRAIRPPTVAPGTARLRLSVTLHLEQGDIARFVESLSRALKREAS